MRIIHRATDEIAELRRIAIGEVPSVHHGPVPLRRVLSRSPSISVAMSWLVTHLIAGFAAYGDAMYACLVPPEEDADLHAGTFGARSMHGQRSDRLVRSPPSSPPWSVEHEAQSSRVTASRSGDPGAFRRAPRFWRKRPGGADKVPAASVESLDDRMLHDIGLHRDEIERLARHMDPSEW